MEPALTGYLSGGFRGESGPLGELEEHGGGVTRQLTPMELATERCTPVSSRTLETEMRASVMMELIVDKLKLLNYEREFCNYRKPPWPRLHKFYFALPSMNRNEQFLYFTSLVAWLFGLIGCRFSTPSEADDPNATCAKILLELRDLGFAPPSWPPARLKQGHGDAVCSVLDTLCSLALEAVKFEFAPVVHLHHDETVVAAPEDDGHNDNTTYELYVAENQIAEETYNDDETPRTVNPRSVNDLNVVMSSNVDPKKWKLELERIAPQLRVIMVADGKDWRAHLDQAQKLYEEISLSFTSSKAQLHRVEEDVTSSLEKLESRENFINQQIEPLIAEYVAVKGRLSEVQEKRNKYVESVASLTSEHAHLVELLEQTKQTMVEKGNEISDLSPLVQIKSAIQKLKLELREMEVRTGVLEHSLLQVGIRQAKRGSDESKC